MASCQRIHYHHHRYYRLLEKTKHLFQTKHLLLKALFLPLGLYRHRGERWKNLT